MKQSNIAAITAIFILAQVQTATSAQDLSALGLLSETAYESLQQGNYSDAETAAKEALSLAEHTFNLQIDLNPFLELLAAVYVSQKKFSEAQPLYARHLGIIQTELGPTHPETAVALNHLALVHKELGQYSKAEELFSKLVNLTEEETGLESYETTVALENLSDTYIALKKYSLAKPLLERALKNTSGTLGQNHEEVTRIQSKLDIITQKIAG